MLPLLISLLVAADDQSQISFDLARDGSMVVDVDGIDLVAAEAEIDVGVFSGIQMASESPNQVEIPSQGLDIDGWAVVHLTTFVLRGEVLEAFDSEKYFFCSGKSLLCKELDHTSWGIATGRLKFRPSDDGSFTLDAPLTLVGSPEGK